MGSSTTVTGDVDTPTGSPGVSIITLGRITRTVNSGFLDASILINQNSITNCAGRYSYVGYYGGHATSDPTGATITVDGTGAQVLRHVIVNHGTLTGRKGAALVLRSTNVTPDLGNVVIGTVGGHA